MYSLIMFTMYATLTGLCMNLPSLAGLSKPQAYLDPGSGSFVLQLLIAALLGAGFLIRTYWSKIKAFFRNKFNKQQDDPSNDPQQ